jgi:hypothetical protein
MTAPVTAVNVLELLAPSPRTSGSILWAPIGATLPTTSYAPIDGTVGTGFKDLGYADDTGLKQRETRSNTDVFMWGGDIGGTLQGNYDRTMMFRLMQFRNTEVLSAAYGISNVSVVAANTTQGKEIAVKLNPKLLDTRSWIFDGFYASNLVRIVIPIGRITVVGEVNMTHKTYMTIECTLKAYPDAQKNHGYLYVNDGVHT